MSVGSDFHGHNKPAIEIGSVEFDKEEIAKLIDKIKNVSDFKK